HDTFSRYGLPDSAHRPCYGLAEATVFVTNTGEEGPTITPFDRAQLAADHGVEVEPGTPAAVELVAAGKPTRQRVRIVHPTAHTVRADGDVGEIWVQGPNVADGYWRKPDRTEQTFHGRITGDSGTWLRTGDLGLVHKG